MNLKTFSVALLCVGLASAGVVAGCAEGEPISESDFKAVGKAGGHAGNSEMLAAGGSNFGSSGSDMGSSGGGSGGDNGSSGSMAMGDSGTAGTASGDSGMAGGGNVYDGPLSTGLKVEYVAQSGKPLSFSVKITNNGSDAPPLSSFTIRYFLSSDVNDASSIVFDDAAWHSGMNMAPYYLGPGPLAPKATYTNLLPTKPMANGYLEFSSSKADQTLGSKDTLEFHPRSTSNGEDQTDDYSYQAGTALAANPHIVVLQGGNVVAGMAP